MAFQSLLNGLLCSSNHTPDVQLPPTKARRPSLEGKHIYSATPTSLSSDSDTPSLTPLAKDIEDTYILPLTSSPAQTRKAASLPPTPPPEQTNRALTISASHTYSLADLPFPIPGANEIVIRNSAVGLNPIDYKSVDYNFCPPSIPWVTGRELVGVVHSIGSSTSSNLNVGDRVWTSTYYRDVRAGCFQEFVCVPSHTVLPIPFWMSDEEAACLGVAGLTAGMTLWRWLDVPLPHEGNHEGKRVGDGKWLLVWGGSTVTGQFAIQFARLSGLNVVAVTSASTAALAMALGATVVVRDGKTEAELMEEIRGIAGDNVTRTMATPKLGGLIPDVGLTRRFGRGLSRCAKPS